MWKQERVKLIFENIDSAFYMHVIKLKDEIHLHKIKVSLPVSRLGGFLIDDKYHMREGIKIIDYFHGIFQGW